MPDQRNPDERVHDLVAIDQQADKEVLMIMLLDDSWPWSVDELGRELRDQMKAEDSLRRLLESGLVHRIGDFVFPTRTARRAAALQLGTA